MYSIREDSLAHAASFSSAADSLSAGKWSEGCKVDGGVNPDCDGNSPGQVTYTLSSIL